MTTPPVNDENYAKCLCRRCATYPGQNDPWQYCGRARSDKEITQRGCACVNDCPVYSQYKLTSAYYCINGKAK